LHRSVYIGITNWTRLLKQLNTIIKLIMVLMFRWPKLLFAKRKFSSRCWPLQSSTILYILAVYLTSVIFYFHELMELDRYFVTITVITV